MPNPSAPVAGVLGTRTGTSTRLSRWLVPLGLGSFGSLLIVASGCLHPSLLASSQVGAWYFGAATGGGLALWVALAVGLAGLVLLGGSWVLALRTADRWPGEPPSTVLGLGLAWACPVVLGPPLLSDDAYSYVAQGQMLLAHLNPYRLGPASLGSAPIVTLVSGYWRRAPAPYGPLFFELDHLLAWLARGSIGAELIELRLIAIAGVALMAFGLLRIAQHLGRPVSPVLVLGVLNPLVVLDLVGGLHNDALMVGLMVAGMALCITRRYWSGIVVVAVAACVKLPAALALTYLSWERAALDSPSTGTASEPLPRRVGRLARAIGIVFVLLVGFSVLGGFGTGAVTSLGAPSAVSSFLAPSTWLGDLVQLLGLDHGASVVLGRTVAAIGGAGALVALFITRSRRPVLSSIGWSFLVVVLASPVVQPWYFCWPLVTLAPVLGARARAAVVPGVLVLSMVALPGTHAVVHQLHRAHEAWGFVVVVLGVCCALGVVLGAARADARGAQGLDA